MSRRICIVRHREYELGLRREAEALRDAGYTVDVICFREPGHRFIENENGVRCFRLPLGRRRAGAIRYVLDYVSFFVGAAVMLTLLDLRHRYAAVQVNTMPDFLVFATIGPRLRGAPIVAFMKEPSPELAEMRFGPTFVTRLMTRIEQAVLRYADLVFTVTEQLKEAYVARGAEAGKIHIVLNGVDPRYMRRDRPVARDVQHFTLVCHGTIEPRYGHDTLLEAVRLARDEVPNIRLRITGAGTAVPRLLELIEQFGIGECVEYLGHVDFDVLAHVLASADLGVVAMRKSPYADLVHTNKMFDFIGLGTPVLATRLNAVEAYFDEASVALVEPDDPKDMARAIVELARDAGKLRSLAARASLLYERYGWERQRSIYVDAYTDLFESSTVAPTR